MNLCLLNEESQPSWNQLKLQPSITHVELEVCILLIDENKIPVIPRALIN